MQSFLICLAILHSELHTSLRLSCVKSILHLTKSTACQLSISIIIVMFVQKSKPFPLTVACHSKLRAHLNCAYSKNYLVECFHTHQEKLDRVLWKMF